jgi:adenylate cyclase class 2
MTYEVELKFPLADFQAVRENLRELPATAQPAVEQVDRYFAHPQRDFAQTDEALRLRSVGTWNGITYKGPVVDQQTKTRHEIEIPYAEGQAAADQFAELLTRLGFREVRAVRKRRTPFHLNWEGRPLEIVLDEVEGLGRFIELEGLADESERDALRDSILRLARRFGLEHPERKSYLCLLLEREKNR